MSHTIAHLILCAAVAGCAGLAAEHVAPSHPVASVPESVPAEVAQPRVDSRWDVASGYCESMWDATGMQLEETPEHDDLAGLDCVYSFPAAEPFLCSENGGSEVRSYDHHLCVVSVRYDWACKWIGACLP